MNCIDVSNYTGPISPQQAANLVTAGVKKVIVQAVAPPYPYPRGVTRQQIATLQAAGLDVEAYIYLWWNEGAAGILNRLGLLKDTGVKRVWVDVEDTTSGYSRTYERKTIAQSVDYIVQAGYSTGIYTGRWFWWYDMTDFSYLPLWAAEYDGIDDPSIFVPFGGWTQCEIKQFDGTSSLPSVPIDHVDLNVFQEQEVTDNQKRWLTSLVNTSAIVLNEGDVRDLSQQDKEALRELSAASQVPY